MSKWISVEDKLPNHLEIVHVYTKKGTQAICIFLKGEEVKKELEKANRYIPPQKKEYYFASQEISGNALNGVTHWSPLKRPPV